MKTGNYLSILAQSRLLSYVVVLFLAFDGLFIERCSSEPTRTRMYELDNESSIKAWTKEEQKCFLTISLLFVQITSIKRIPKKSEIAEFLKVYCLLEND